MNYVLRLLRASILSLCWGISAAAHLTSAELPEEFHYVPVLRFFEQVLNDKVEDTKNFFSIHDAKLDAPYRPESQTEFPLAAFWVPSDELVILNTNKQIPDLRLQDSDGGKTLFFVHPESANFFAERFNKSEKTNAFVATPLASYRSLIVWDPKNPTPPMNLKVSLNKKIGETSRMMTRSQIERATAMSLILKKVNMQFLNQRGIYFVDEPFSVFLKDLEVGYSLRELPKMNKESVLAPMFSLYASRRGKPIIVDLVEKSRLPAKTFLGEKIIRPMVEHMFILVFEEGVVGEPHEQNVMVEIRDGKLTGKFYYRDLAGFAVNPEMRLAAGKDMSFIPATFNKKSLKVERAKVVDNLMSYLAGSNFYALGEAVKTYFPGITREWIKDQIFGAMSAQVFMRTGFSAQSESQLKGLITRHMNEKIKARTQFSCSLF
ncbi:MAG: hypothetical protein A4S09_05585 [Proteobacteria bacterium SG_bin7]|nr:MAG: hypothetical protein A4S09_05585 [Proteobacteria bacterium SG_bin7]